MISDSEFESTSEPIPQDVENSLERAVRDYDSHWKGVIGEAIQNSIDGYYTNREWKDNIPEDRKLIIELSVDSTSNKFIWKDNAGGMTEEVFLTKFPGLDTPGPEKQSGKSMGSWGRGVHVIVQASDDEGKAIAETLHSEYHGLIDIRRSRFAEITDFEGDLAETGTKVTVHSLRTRVMMELTNFSQVKDYIQGRFQRALENEDIEIRYEVDGSKKIIPPYDFSNHEVLWGPENIQFGESEEVLKNVVVYKKEPDSECPFNGVSMNKSNEYRGEPFMRVKEFTPHAVKNLDKMFGFCDASTLCPEHENNAHNDFLQRQAVIRAKRALREKLNEIDAENFLGKEKEVKPRQELVEEALDRFEDYWGEETPLSVGAAGEFELDGEDEGGSSGNNEDGDSYDDGDTEGQDDKSREKPFVELSIGSRVFEEGDEVAVDARLVNSENENSFEVRGSLKTPEGGKEDLSSSPAIRLPPSKESVSETTLSVWNIEPDEKGKYVINASLVDAESDETLDTVDTFFYYGVNPFVKGGATNPGINVSWVIGGSEDVRYHITEQKTGLTLNVNTSHPEWMVAEKRDGNNSIDQRATLLAQWFQEAVMLHNLKDELGEESEQFKMVQKRFIEKNSEFAAENYKRYI